MLNLYGIEVYSPCTAYNSVVMWVITMESLFSTLLVFMLNSLLIARLCDSNYTSSIRIKTQIGEIEGSLMETSTSRSVRVFYGIPFAQPPVGELRFKPPQPYKNQNDVLMAKMKPNACIQGPLKKVPKFSGDTYLHDTLSEDCLYLNIWTPNSLTKNLAVMIFVHGGGYLSQSSTLELYDGGVLATEEGVIVVTINYRLSLFGFLYLDDGNIAGNVGLMDQAMAFKWVRENIQSFGGDPDQITIFGQSAGGAAVSNHFILPSSQGLFARGIVQSGSVFSRQYYQDKNSSLTQSKSLAHAVGCDASSVTDMADCLRNKSVDELFNASLSIKFPFIPTVDGVYFPYTPNETLGKGYLNKDIDIMIGRTTADGFTADTLNSGKFNNTLNFFASEDYFTKYVVKSLGTNDTNLAESVKYIYSKNYQSGDNYRLPLIDLISDVKTTCSQNQLTEMLTQNGNNVYTYLYSYISPVSPFFKWEEVPHASELPFIFGLPLDPRNNYTEKDIAFSKRMMKYWTSFAKFGFPSDSNVTKSTYSTQKWPIRSTGSEEIYVLDEESGLISDKTSVDKCNLLLSVPTYTDNY